jgi:hypothetical protein
MKAQMIENLRKSLPPARPNNATIDVHLDSIPGTYVDAAYGEMTICAWNDKRSVAVREKKVITPEFGKVGDIGRNVRSCLGEWVVLERLFARSAFVVPCTPQRIHIHGYAKLDIYGDERDGSVAVRVIRCGL